MRTGIHPYVNSTKLPFHVPSNILVQIRIILRFTQGHFSFLQLTTLVSFIKIYLRRYLAWIMYYLIPRYQIFKRILHK